MSSKLKVWVYGTPFSGKSYFANTFPKPYVINTDGNLQFYGKEVDGVQVTTIEEFIREVQNFDSDKYDTLVIDVLDHVYDMARESFLKSNGVEHESDFPNEGAFGKGWTLMREQFWYMISKIRNIDSNIVLISHDEEKTKKGKFGQELTNYTPATVPTKLVNRMVGIMHFVGRCYFEDGNHYVSFGGNDNETSGYRLPIKNKIIPNDYDDFIKNIEQ